MDGDEELLAKKEVDVLRLETVFRLAEVDAVQNQIEVVAVGLDFGMVNLTQRVLDRQLVKVKHVAEDPDFFRGGGAEVHPDPNTAAALEPRRVDAVRAARGATLVAVDRNHRERF